MMVRTVSQTVSSFADTVLSGPKTVGVGLAVVVSALVESMTSILTVILAGLFLADLFLGVLKAVHKYGVDGFDWARFGRAWIKLGASIVAVALFTFGDLLIHQSGVPGSSESWRPFTTAALLGMSYGFFWSALGSLGYFWPEAKSWVEGALHTVRQPDESHPLRRSTDPHLEDH